MRTRLSILGTILAIVAIGLLASPAAAQTDVYGEDPEEVCDEGVGGDSTNDPDCGDVLDENEVKSGAVAQPEVLNSSTGLPVTGGDAVTMTIVGLGAIGLGTAFVTYRRRHAE